MGRQQLLLHLGWVDGRALRSGHRHPDGCAALAWRLGRAVRCRPDHQWRAGRFRGFAATPVGMVAVLLLVVTAVGIAVVWAPENPSRSDRLNTRAALPARNSSSRPWASVNTRPRWAAAVLNPGHAARPKARHPAGVCLHELDVRLGETATGFEAVDPLREQMLGSLFSNNYINSLGRVRRLRRLRSSIEGNALRAMLRSGLGDEGLSSWLCGCQRQAVAALQRRLIALRQAHCALP
jgi:hypothetical protein